MRKNNPPLLGPDGKRKKMNFGCLKRVLKMLYSYYPVLLPIIIALQLQRVCFPQGRKTKM